VEASQPAFVSAIVSAVISAVAPTVAPTVAPAIKGITVYGTKAPSAHVNHEASRL